MREGEDIMRSLIAFPEHRLFEDVTINVGVLLAVDSDGGVPGPLVLDELLVLGVGGVELAEVVALPVRGDLEGGLPVLTTDQEDTADDAVVVLAVDRLSTEQVLAGSLETGVETTYDGKSESGSNMEPKRSQILTDQVVGHEGELQLVVVLVVNSIERVLLGLVVLPEPGQSNGAGVLVRVLTLPLIKDELGLAKSLKRVLGLLLRLGLILSSRSSSLGRGSGRSSLGLLLLLGRGVLDSLLSEDRAGNNGLERSLVDDSVVPSGDGNVLRAPSLVQDGSESAGEERGSEVVGEGDALTNQVGVGGEVLLEDGDSLVGSLGGLFNVLLVVGVKTQQRAVPGAELGEDLSVDKREPAEDGSVVLLGLAQESGLLVLGGHFESSQSHNVQDQWWFAKMKQGQFLFGKISAKRRGNKRNQSCMLSTQ
jgi:hypothetical protein